MDTGGEDAYLCTHNVQCVLDGVSWWLDKAQVNAGLYSAALARRMYDHVEEDLLGDVPASSLRLLQDAYSFCKQGNINGTCTALVATLQEWMPDVQKKEGYLFVNPDALCVSTESSPIDSAAVPNSSAEEPCIGNFVSDSGLCEHANVVPSSRQVGSSTCCGRGIDSKLISAVAGGFLCSESIANPLLDVAMVGDCSLMIVRNGNIRFITEEQCHNLDYPFQIGTGSKDSPATSVRLLIPVCAGDIVVIGSDGVFDNLYPEQISDLLWSSLKDVFTRYNLTSTVGNLPDLSPTPLQGSENVPCSSASLLVPSHSPGTLEKSALFQEMMAALHIGAENVTKEAVAMSRSVRGDSPYASKCVQNGALYEGGKPDDITLLVSVIGYSEDCSDSRHAIETDLHIAAPYRDWP